jgi:hypothetical protein
MPKVAVSTGLTPLKGFPGLLAASGGSGTLDPTGLPNLAQDGVPADAALLVSDSLGRRLLGSELWLPRKILATAYRDAEGDVHVEGAYVRDEPSPFPAAAPLRCLDVCPPDLLAMACARLTDRSLAGLAGPIAWMPLSRWAGPEVSIALLDLPSSRPWPALVVMIETRNAEEARGGLTLLENLAQPFGVEFRDAGDGTRMAPLDLAPGVVVAWTVEAGRVFLASRPEALVQVREAVRHPSCRDPNPGPADAAAVIRVDTVDAFNARLSGNRSVPRTGQADRTLRIVVRDSERRFSGLLETPKGLR